MLLDKKDLHCLNLTIQGLTYNFNDMVIQVDDRTFNKWHNFLKTQNKQKEVKLLINNKEKICLNLVM